VTLSASDVVEFMLTLTDVVRVVFASATTRNVLENIKLVAEIAAYASAASFFVWKLRGGYLIVNAAVGIDVQRVKHNDTSDYLAISAKLIKRGIGSLVLHDARARLTCAGQVTELALAGYERLAYRYDEANPPRARVLFNQQSDSVPFLFLTPDEEATFSTYAKIPNSEPCLVEVVFSGTRVRRKRIGQWRSSLVSLPRTEVKVSSPGA